MGLADDLSHKLGPAPVWVYGVGFAGVYAVIARRSAAKKAAAAAAATTKTAANNTTGTVSPTSNDPSDSSVLGGTDPSTGLPFSEEDAIDPATGLSYLNEYQQEQNPISQMLASDPTNAAYPVGATPNGISSPVSNAQWGSIATDYLISQGDIPTDVNSAIYAYLNGQTLNATQSAIIDMAERYFGNPPQPITTGSYSDPNQSTATTSPTSTGSTTPGSTGFGVVPLKNPDTGNVEQFIDLGVVPGPGNSGANFYQVGGGAPVYFGGAQGIAQGSTYDKPPFHAYVPIAWQADVASAPGIKAPGE